MKYHLQEQEIADISKLANLLDNKFKIPGTKFSLGIDSIIGLIPVVGDTITSSISLYILARAHKLGVPFLTKCRMGWHIFIDWLIGLIPFFGDIFDIGYKANLKNVRLLEKHLADKQFGIA